MRFKIKTVGVSYGYGSVDELKKAGAFIIAGSPKEVADSILE